MIHSPFNVAQSVSLLATIGTLAVVAAGLALMCQLRKLGIRLMALGVFLAAMAGLLPHWMR
ncbi:MAG TPA: hypothetical protein VG897_18000 [Terriglobales bacterium]|nr:hypothetical protein [Terriglobales bacterium]